MATLKELRDVRIQKLEKLRALGIDPYPAQSKKNIDNKTLIDNFAKNENKEFVVAGYTYSIRKHGKLAFIDLKDATGLIQLYLKEENIQNPNRQTSSLAFEDVDLLDTGDYVEATGKLVKTQAGEVSIEVTNLRILSKTLRPLPDTWEGLKDKETRMRRRYLDTKINEDVYNRYIRRAKFWQAHREFFKQHGFFEINIPVLENIPGGADANPFVTHMDAIDQDFYLRISQELYLKRLIGGGYEKVYEIGPRFRNEGLSDEHLPEHMAMEFYWAYADWREGMQFIKDLFAYILETVYDGKTKFSIRGFDVDFANGWEEIDFAEVMLKNYNLDIHNATPEEVAKICAQHGIKDAGETNISRGIDALWKKLRTEIAGPAFLINHPKYLSPLSKAKFDEPHIVERFQPIIAGSELGNGWSEINDPLDQLARFREQQNLRDSGDAEAQWLDIDYVEMLEYGMPPTFGYGHAERTFWFLEDVSAREGVPFPQLRHLLDETSREIYGLEVLPEKEAKSPIKETNMNENLENLPTREEATKLLEKHVPDDYQKMHARMVATVLEEYAQKLGENEDLWYLTGLLHDLDYFEHPEEHPSKSLEWFKEWEYPEALSHAVAAHAHDRTGVTPQTKLAGALIAVDEMAGFLYAYSLMRPEGFDGMQPSSVKKKFKDKGFAKKIDRDEIIYGIESFGVDFDEHVTLMIDVLGGMGDFS